MLFAITSYNVNKPQSQLTGSEVRSNSTDTMLYLFSKYDAFVFGSKIKLYQKRVMHLVNIKASSTSKFFGGYILFYLGFVLYKTKHV